MMGWLPQNDLLGKAGLCVCVCVLLATSLEFSPNHSKGTQEQHLCGSKSVACCESDLYKTWSSPNACLKLHLGPYLPPPPGTTQQILGCQKPGVFPKGNILSA